MTGERRCPKQFAVLLVGLLLYAVTTNADGTAGGKLRVLLIGNSLTYWNDLPAILESMANAGSHQKVTVETIGLPNYSLEDHWKRGDALKKIRKERWDYVVLQQGPSASPEARASLMEYSVLFSENIRAAGGKVALYSVWPSRLRSGDMLQSIESYRLAAKKSDALLLPVSGAWRNAWEMDPRLELYGPDGLHPSLAGSYLAAIVMCKQLCESKCEFSSRQIDVPASTADILQRAATKALQSDP